jgi:hypothetical protein
MKGGKQLRRPRRMMMRWIRDMEQNEVQKERSMSTKEPISTQNRRNKNLQDIKRPATTYAAECWALRKDIAKRLVALTEKF